MVNSSRFLDKPSGRAERKEYIWLVNTIRKARRITFAEINEKWLQTDMSEGVVC